MRVNAGSERHCFHRDITARKERLRVLRLKSYAPVFFTCTFKHLILATVREDSCSDRLVRRAEMLA